MKFTHLAFGGAASLALVGFSSAGLAQQSPYTTNSTPQERAQTGALNAKQAADSGTTEDGHPGRIADAQYAAQQQQYEAQQSQYQGQQAQYQHRLAHYEYDRSHSRYWWRARYDRATLDGLYGIPRHDLLDKEVDERDGLKIGRIRDVEHAPDGRVERVDVALSDNRATWISASDLRYDARNQVVFTDVSVDELYGSSRDGDRDTRP